MLKPVGQYLGQEFAQGVEKGDGAIRLWDGVVRFVRLWDDDADGVFEVRWPRSGLADFVKEIRQGAICFREA